MKPDDPKVLKMESRLRYFIGKHRDAILSQSVDIAQSRSSFIKQMADRASGLDVGQKPIKKQPKIKLVSIDIEKSDVHQLLIEHVAPNASSFFDFALRDIPGYDKIRDGCYVGENFYPNTHITLAFAGRTSQTEMLRKFGALQGKEVEFSVKAFFWNDQVAALAVDLAKQVPKDKKQPKSENAFPHITVWVAAGAQAYMSNKLPALVDNGEASRIDLPVPITMTGNITFWDNGNKPVTLDYP